MPLSRLSSSGGFENAGDCVVPIHFLDSQNSPGKLQTVEKVDSTKIQPLWRSLFAFTTRADCISMVCSGAGSFLTGVLKPTAAIFFGQIFSVLTEFGGGTLDAKDMLHGISIWCIALTALGISVWFTEGIFFSSWIIFGENQAKVVREKTFAALLDKEQEWYDLRDGGIGSLLIRIQTQVRELQIAVSQPLGLLLYEIVASLASLAIALFFSWKLTLVMLATFPFVGIILFLVSKGLSPAIESQKRELSKASKYANTAVSAIDTVKTFNGQNHEIWQYQFTIKKVTAYYLLQARSNALQFGITRFLIVGLFVQGFWFGIYLVNNGLDPGHVLTTFYACLSAMQGIEVVLPQFLVLAKGISAGQTLKSIMNEMQVNQRRANVGELITPKSCPGEVEIKNIYFAYPSNIQHLVLHNVSLFFPAGETTFIVGSSGSGKSTVGNLVMKYYKPLAGDILVDGNSIQNLDNDWLRHNITLVQQDSVLFNETILQNISFGNRDNYDIEDVKKACETAYLRETIQEMPDGLDTVAGLGGRLLSGGQRQRVAIARARLRDAPILIMDESTSALDYTSRQQVMEAIRQWRKGKTTIIITHDTSQILQDDYVYVLDHTQVIQEGYRKKLDGESPGTFASISCFDRSLEVNQQVKTPGVRSVVELLEEEDFSNRWDYISKVFSKSRTPPSTAIAGFQNHNRLSFGFRVAQANALKSDLIGSSPTTLSSPHISFITPSASPRVPSPTSINKETGCTPRAPVPDFSSSKHESPLPRLRSLPTNAGTTSSRSSLVLPRPPGEVVREKIPGDKPEEVNAAAPVSLTRIFSTIWPILSPKDRIIFLAGFFASFVVAVGTPAFAYVFARLLSVFYLPQEDRAEQALKFALALLGIAIVDGFASFCAHYMLEYSAQSWITSLRLEALKRILAQPKSWFDDDRNSPSRLNESLDRNAEEMRNLVGRFAGLVFTVLWMLGICIVWSFIISWKLTLVALGCAPVVYAITRIFHVVSSKWEDRCNKCADIASSICTETFTNIRVVRALTLESYFAQKHRSAMNDAYKTGVSRAVYAGSLYGVSDALNIFITALVFYYGTVIIGSGSHSVGSILQIVNILLFGISNASSMYSMVPQITSSCTTATYMLRLANLPLHNSYETQGTTRLPSPLPIRMTNLSFTHPSQPHMKTLSNISLHIEPGTCTAIVGPSGSGKSTIASLLQCLYAPDPSSPSPLTFAGVPQHECHISALRAHIASVPQSPILFPTTVLSNITYGLPESSPLCTLEAAQRAAAHAGIHPFIASLENGYETLIGDGGMGLSGGQTQRVALARALVRRPKVLVLDEATSALDAESAEGVRAVVRRVVGEGTAVVVVSHSVEMMKVAQRVVVVREGTVVEEGVFAELCERGGELARLIGVEKGRGQRIGHVRLGSNIGV